MKKLKIIFFILTIFFSNISYLAADKEGLVDKSYLKVKINNLKNGNDTLKKALKYKKKNKIEKANKKLEKALSFFVLANKEIPNNIEVLKQLGFVYYLVGDTIMSEIYYLEGLEIDPNNNLINQRLGELYFNTKRVDLANERLEVLSICNCGEYSELKEIISGIKKSKY